MPPTATTLALAPSDFVLIALLAFTLLYLLPRRLLHYWGRGAPPAAAAGRATTRRRRG